MSKAYYAVKKGKVPGVYQSWAECQDQVSGVSGAEYKKFDNEADAREFVTGDATKSGRVGYEAYVDGSYHEGTGQTSYGMVILKDGEVIEEAAEAFGGEANIMRNVAGELRGAMHAMKYCYDHDIPKVVIYHDYLGISEWCTGRWKTKNEWTQAYAKFCAQIAQKVDISFVKVKGHSGNKYNDRADALAREALGI